MSYLKPIKNVSVFLFIAILNVSAHAGRYDGLAEVFNRVVKQPNNVPTRAYNHDVPGFGGDAIGANPRGGTSAIPYNGQWEAKGLTPSPKYNGSSVSNTFNYNARP